MARKSPMAVNKSQTPLWMRVVIIIVAVSFVLAGVAVVFAGIGGNDTDPASTGTTGTGGALFADSYQPRVDAAVLAMNSDPGNPDIIAQVGHAYYEWAVAVYESGQVPASIPFWLSAVSYYEQVLAINPDDDIVLGNRAFALYYAQSDDAQAGLQAFIDGASDNAALAAQVENARGMLAELQSAGVGSVPSTTTP